MTSLHPQRAARWGWFLVIWGAPWSHAAMSVGTAWVALCAVYAWVTSRHDDKVIAKHGLRSPFVWLSALLGWQGLSLLWSENVEAGLHMLSIQGAMLVLALSWRKVPLFHAETARTWVFRSATLALAGVLLWGFWQTAEGVSLAPRDWTPWMSHIRLSMFAALAMVWGAHDQPKSHFWAFALLWAGFTAVTGSFTSALLLPSSAIWAWHISASNSTRRGIAWGVVTLGVIAVAAVALWLQPVPLPVPAEELPRTTSLGNPYTHHPDRILSEGGHRIYLFLCENEWEGAWSQVSTQPLSESNAWGYQTRDRLLRFLTSKGWPKDAEHILKLTPEEVNAIESGATHARPASGLSLRLRETRREWEIWQEGGNASGHALLQRMEHWKAGIAAVERSPWLGQGVGDVDAAIQKSYNLLDSRLARQHRHRAHMQHLTWAVSGGLVAVVLWLVFGWAWWHQIGRSTRMALWGGVLVAVSCLFEDTWETQAGVVVSFLALFADGTPPGYSEDLSS